MTVAVEIISYLLSLNKHVDANEVFSAIQLLGIEDFLIVESGFHGANTWILQFLVEDAHLFKLASIVANDLRLMKGWTTPLSRSQCQRWGWTDLKFFYSGCFTGK